MKVICAVLVSTCISVSAFAGFNGPVQTSIGATAGKSMTGVHGQGSFATLQFDFSRAFLHHTEATWGVQPFFIRQPSHFFTADGHGTQSALGLQLTLGLRHHFGSESRNVRPFAEIASGPLFTDKKVPVTASKINFNSYGTIGATFGRHNGYRPYAGFRFGHISNAGIVADRNPGYNIFSAVFGVRLVR